MKRKDQYRETSNMGEISIADLMMKKKGTNPHRRIIDAELMKYDKLTLHAA